ncbi:MAG: DUF2905 domain-containing protein [Candidatus Omnitrophica bacterium]|nr:DUF2905 domain-containing protein [Candidatus Omnitrophota bacterium]
MSDLGKTLIIIGAFILFIGVVVMFVGKIPGVGKLPGDFLIKKDNFTFYFPLSTCILLSVVLSLILYLFNKR